MVARHSQEKASSTVSLPPLLRFVVGIDFRGADAAVSHPLLEIPHRCTFAGHPGPGRCGEIVKAELWHRPLLALT
jgi:hypothetical protein